MPLINKHFSAGEAVTEPQVWGLDLSLTCTGVATVSASGRPCAFQVEPGRTLRGLRRMRSILTQLRTEIAHPDRPPTFVVLEGPALGSTTGQVYERYGLAWMVRDMLDLHHIKLAVVPPTSLKKYATGKGNAGKDRVMIEVTRRWPNYDATDNNTTDAVVLCEMGRYKLGLPALEMPKVNRDSIGKCDWSGWE